MIAAVDIGNSNIVIGLMNNERKVQFSVRIRSDKQKTKEEFMIELKNLMDIYQVSFEVIKDRELYYGKLMPFIYARFFGILGFLRIRIPGYLVDIVVVDPDQTQLYGGAPVNRFISPRHGAFSRQFLAVGYK